MAEYPNRWECDVVLTDGETVHLRPIRSEDAAGERSFLEQLTPETVFLRFQAPRRTFTDEEISYFTGVDYDMRMALVAELGGGIIAIGRYDRLPEAPDEAEVAFVVADAHQGRGIGTLLLEHLAAIARRHGVDKFHAYVLPQNRGMITVFQDAGFDASSTYDEGVVRFTIPVDLTDTTLAAIEAREQRARARSIERLLHPRSVAVVGAGRERGNVGHEIFRNILLGEFRGPVHPVNPSAEHVASVAAQPTVRDISGPVDLAVIAVPPRHVLPALDDCAAKDVHGLVIVSAGFAETGEDGAELERQMLDAARRHGMRVVGPNCLGIVNTDEAVQLNATFSPDPPTPGNAAFMSQSGALGIAIMDQAESVGIGISSFVSVGNKADVSGNDLLEYWQEDDRTEVVLLYLESFGNPRQFGRIARRVSAAKPIVAVKGGRTPAGSRAASSHTAAMATPEVAVDALFRQTGVIRVDTLQDLFDVAQLLCNQPLPAGRRVGIVSNGGGPGILAADACESVGLEVPELHERTRAALHEVCLPGAAVTNPVDLLAAAGPDHFAGALELVLADPNVDAVLVSYTPPLVTDPTEIAEAVSGVAGRATKPMVANFLDSDTKLIIADSGGEDGCSRRVPVYLYPESATRALARAAWYGEWRGQPTGTVPTFADLDMAGARTTVARAIERGGRATWIEPEAAFGLLTAYGIPVARTHEVASPEAAAERASEIGFPVALKVVGPDLVHKTDVGGVVLGLDGPEKVEGAYREMQARLGARMTGAAVQAMVPEGVETIAGIVHDPAFGPLVMFGLGGITAELLGDRAFRVLPLTDLDVRDLVDSIHSAPLLHGYRNTPQVDVDALHDCLLRVGRLADDVPQIREMDINPLIVSPSGVTAVDVRVLAGPYAEDPGLGTRRLG